MQHNVSQQPKLCRPLLVDVVVPSAGILPLLSVFRVLAAVISFGTMLGALEDAAAADSFNTKSEFDMIFQLIVRV